MGADKDVDGIVADQRLAEDLDRGRDHLIGPDHELGTVKTRPSGRWPAVGDDVTPSVVRARYQALQAHPRLPGGLDNRGQQGVLAQVTWPRQRPFDKQVAAVAPRGTYGIEMHFAGPARTKRPRICGEGALRAEADGHWRHATGTVPAADARSFRHGRRRVRTGNDLCPSRLGICCRPLPEFSWDGEYLEEYSSRFLRDGDEGRLVCVTPQEKTWSSWERHPAGDELVVLLSGRVDVIQDLPEGHHTVSLRAGRAMVNPKGVWHTNDVHEPGSALFVTPGAGTEHRPRR